MVNYSGAIERYQTRKIPFCSSVVKYRDWNGNFFEVLQALIGEVDYNKNKEIIGRKL